MDFEPTEPPTLSSTERLREFMVRHKLDNIPGVILSDFLDDGDGAYCSLWIESDDVFIDFENTGSGDLMELGACSYMAGRLDWKFDIRKDYGDIFLQLLRGYFDARAIRESASTDRPVSSVSKGFLSLFTANLSADSI